jgi:lipopolysaccharide/colanic/teichoic acid biosynthesis glycosyltransferase
MSLVGPRPEIPKFVNEFKDIIPLYMVKHYVKPGMTGLAQVKGLRGDASLEDRIHEDIAYIENWSLLLDIMILLKTPLKAVNKNERFVAKELQGTRLDDEMTRSH